MNKKNPRPSTISMTFTSELIFFVQDYVPIHSIQIYDIIVIFVCFSSAFYLPVLNFNIYQFS